MKHLQIVIFKHSFQPQCQWFNRQIKQIKKHLAKLIYYNFQPLKVVSRYRDPQPQVVENYSYLFNLRWKIS